MKLNADKTKLIVFNSYDSKQMIPFVSLSDGQPIQCVESIRLLGLIIDHKLSWWDLLLDIEDRARKKIWGLLPRTC